MFIQERLLVFKFFSLLFDYEINESNKNCRDKGQKERQRWQPIQRKKSFQERKMNADDFNTKQDGCSFSSLSLLLDYDIKERKKNCRNKETTGTIELLNMMILTRSIE